MGSEFLITEIESDFDNEGTVDGCEIRVVTTHGTFVIWVQTQGQRNGKLLVEVSDDE